MCRVLFLFFIIMCCDISTASMMKRLGCMTPEMKEKLSIEITNPLAGSTDINLEVAMRGPFKTLVGDTNRMTERECIHRCINKQYSFAALQDGTRCYCARTLRGMDPVQADPSQVKATECKGGDCQHLCQGRSALFVYQTGYESKSSGKDDTDVINGLLGCFEETAWQDWCETPDAADSQRRNPQHLEEHPFEPVSDDGDHGRLPAQKPEGRLAAWHDPELYAMHKPPLVSPSMSARLCAIYCINGAVSSPVAVIKRNNTCCCGGALDKAAILAQSRVDFHLYCSLPCADVNSQPLCVGFHNGRHYVTVYQTLSIWDGPNRPKEFTKKDEPFVKDPFSENDTVDESSNSAEWPPAVRSKPGKEGDLQPWPPGNLDPPIVDHANKRPFADVVDMPDADDRGGGVWVVLFVAFFSSFLLFLAIFLILEDAREQSRRIQHGQKTKSNNYAAPSTSSEKSLFSVSVDSADNSELPVDVE